MATITERTHKNGRKIFRVEIRIKGNPTLSKSFDRKTDATIWAQKQEAAIKQGSLVTLEADRKTIGEMIDSFLDDVVLRMGKSSRVNYSQQLRWFRDRIGSMTLRKLTPNLILNLRKQLLEEDLPRKRTSASCNRYIACLSSCCTYAVEQQILKDNPCKKVKKLSEPRGRTRFLSDSERERLLDVCKAKSPQIHLAVILALATGARKEEIWNLSWQEVDLKEGYLTFSDTKNNDIRSVPVIGHALYLLREYHQKYRLLHTPLLFPSSQDPQKPLDLRKQWESAVRKAEIENFRYHDLRHSAASYMVRSGLDLRLVAEILGHRTLQMTMRYSHLQKDHLRQAMIKTMGGNDV